MRFRQLAPIVFATLMCTTAASAAVSPQQKAMARRAAELDAYRLLAEQILGLQIDSSTTVRDFALESDRIATALDHFVKGIRFTDARFYNDGTWEVDAEITIAQVVTQLKKITDEHYRGGKWTRERFEEISRKTDRKIIGVTGTAAVLGDTTLPEPAAVAIVPQLAGAEARNLPPIYTGKARERLMARRAAQMDAYRKLVERVYGFALSSRSLAENMAGQEDVIKARCQKYLKGARLHTERYRPDGMVEVEAELTIAQVVTTIKKVVDETYSGGSWKTKVEEEINRETDRKVISVVGLGALKSAGGTTTTGPSGNGGSSDHGGASRRTETTVIIRGPRFIAVE